MLTTNYHHHHQRQQLQQQPQPQGDDVEDNDELNSTGDNRVDSDTWHCLAMTIKQLLPMPLLHYYCYCYLETRIGDRLEYPMIRLTAFEKCYFEVEKVRMRKMRKMKTMTMTMRMYRIVVGVEMVESKDCDDEMICDCLKMVHKLRWSRRRLRRSIAIDMGLVYSVTLYSWVSSGTYYRMDCDDDDDGDVCLDRQLRPLDMPRLLMHSQLLN